MQFVLHPFQNIAQPFLQKYLPCMSGLIKANRFIVIKSFNH